MPVAQHPYLSLCVLTRNEELFLSECLSSAARVADEIVIVDTGSTDRTLDIARSYTELVYSMEFVGDFSAARNSVLELANGTWILFLDADERFEPEQASKILPTLVAADTDVFGFRVFRYDFYVTSGWFATPRVRFFRNDDRIRYEGRVHDEVAGAISRAGGVLADAPLLLDHFGTCRPYAARQAKSRRYLEILQEILRDRPDDATRHALAGLQLRNLRRFDEAKKEADIALALDPTSPIVRKYCGHVLRSIDDLQGARACYNEGLASAPHGNAWDRAAFLGLVALTEMMAGELSHAESHVQQALMLAPDLPHLRINAGLICEAREDFAGAVELYEQAAASHPPFLLEWPRRVLEEPAFTALEYDTTPHYAGLRRHTEWCRARAGQAEVANA